MTILICGACGLLADGEPGDVCPNAGNGYSCVCCGCLGGPGAVLAPRPDYGQLGVEGIDYAEAARLARLEPSVLTPDDVRMERLSAILAADPVASWIVLHAVRDYPEAAAVILGLFPTTLGALDAEALDRGWCSDWSWMVARAVADGVLRPVAAEVTPC